MKWEYWVLTWVTNCGLDSVAMLKQELDQPWSYVTGCSGNTHHLRLFSTHKFVFGIFYDNIRCRFVFICQLCLCNCVRDLKILVYGTIDPSVCSWYFLGMWWYRLYDRIDFFYTLAVAVMLPEEDLAFFNYRASVILLVMFLFLTIGSFACQVSFIKIKRGEKGGV